MARLVTGKLFRMIYAVGEEVRQPIIVEAESMDEADRFMMLHAAQAEQFPGTAIKALAVSELQFEDQ